MIEPHDYYANARNIAIDYLRREEAPTLDKVREVAGIAAKAATLFDRDASVDEQRLIAELRHLFAIAVERATILEDRDPKEHVAWLSARRGAIQWRFWNRYMTYLERDFGMPPLVVNSLHEITDLILERLEDPERGGPWDRRGMVVGSVQSGKTANYTGLICKAVDAGYKLIIVLAGTHSNLRSQTQLRIDEGVLGFDTQKNRRLHTDNRWIGVGKLPGERLHIHSLTSSADDGDFNKNVAATVGVMLGSDPVVLVVKKNSRLLANLMKWVYHVAGTAASATTSGVVRGVPLLLIDDEADNASINTRKSTGAPEDDTVTAINGRIREILKGFEKSAYVGYTATPFANIFVNPDAQTEKHGDDIFPRSFIINVKPPSNYIGPARVFGLDGDVDAGIESRSGLPIITEISDYALEFPPGHRKDHVPAALPGSLKAAVRHFIIASAARRARGHDRKHSSMLIHVTRFVDVQQHVVGLVRDELIALQRRLEHGDGERMPTLRSELARMWTSVFVPAANALGSESGALLTWDEVDAQLYPAAAKIVIRPINGYAKEALDYVEHEAEGLSVIAIGGDKLSRGLTLEGLAVSYFLRTSRMYDTLMQMGRWFGYRPGYLDLCRLFTTRDLVGWYKHIALADIELRREFDYMVAAGLTPAQYGLRVRTHPAGMTVTALNKMCHTQTLELSWAGVLVQTTQIPKDLQRTLQNLETTDSFVRFLGEPEESDEPSSHIWRGVSAASVATFVESLRFPPAAARASGDRLAKFIRQQATKAAPELTDWTVVLISKSRNAGESVSRTIGGREVRPVLRTPETQTHDVLTLRKANILSPSDEARDLDIEATEAVIDHLRLKPSAAELLEGVTVLPGQTVRDIALEITRRKAAAGELQRTRPDTEVPNGRIVRELRSKSNALLLIYPMQPPEYVAEDVDGDAKREPTGLQTDGPPLIGVALSFPTSDTVTTVEYRVNKIWDVSVLDDPADED